MKLGIINLPTHNFSKANFDVLRRATQENPSLDVLLAPEYFLSGFRLVNSDEREDVLGVLTEISKGSNTLLFPGTMLVNLRDINGFFNYCPVFLNGRNIADRVKMNPILEEKNLAINLVYSRPDSLEPLFFEGIGISVEICLDHSLCEPDTESRLHLVPSFGLGGGINSQKYSPIRGLHYIALSDGQNLGMRGLFLFNSLNGKCAKFPSFSSSETLEVYSLNIRGANK